MKLPKNKKGLSFNELPTMILTLVVVGGLALGGLSVINGTLVRVIVGKGIC